jgi:hypothetical protein
LAARIGHLTGFLGSGTGVNCGAATAPGPHAATSEPSPPAARLAPAVLARNDRRLSPDWSPP